MGRRLAQLGCLALIGFANPADACINDVELPNHEREFRSQYLGQASLASTSSDPGRPLSDGLLIGVGAALFSGAVVMTLTGVRARK
jgi:hypothetical protein